MRVLSERERRKIDPSDDAGFYETPRFVRHADESFLARLTELYATTIEPDARVFDVMSSWVSHLPEKPFETVIGHGLNADELAANDRLDEWFRQDLNADQQLPLADGAVDAVTCALSVQYLQYPETVFREFRRILAPGGVVIVSFSNRMFPTKAIRAWRMGSMADRVALVERYTAAGGLNHERTVRDDSGGGPFRAVVARHPEGMA